MPTQDKPKLKGRGGSGRGQGRKLGQSTLLAQKIREKMAIELEKRFGPVLSAQLDAAEGIKTEAYDRRTGRLYYKDPGPNTNAFRNIVDHVIGRPTEKVEMSGKDGIPLIINLAK